MGSNVRQIRLGNTGLMVSEYCLGTMSFGSSAWKSWVLDEAQSRPLLSRAVEAGITFFDMANWYSLGVNEEMVTRALLELVPRDHLVLATKVYYPMSGAPNDGGLSRKHILRSVDASLRRMKTDYIDLLVIHAFDQNVPIEETMRALHDLVRAGKVMYLGASTMFAWQFTTMNHVAVLNGWTPFVNMQCQYNLLYREEEREMIPYCRANGIAVTAFSPLARGWLSGTKGRRATEDRFVGEFHGDAVDLAIIDAVRGIAARRGISPTEVALAWVRQNRNITCPIVGISRAAHLDQALAALDLVLEPDELLELDELYCPREVISDQVVNRWQFQESTGTVPRTRRAPHEK
jgi:aryl-alcohol dehydrogenase-like predicted oxidoreductase